MKKLVVSLYGGPGAGKTTLAAELFVELKKNNIDVEIVSEFAKDLVLEGRSEALKHQWYVIANQAFRIQSAYEHMQVVITDSPLLLGPIYDPESSPALLALCLEHYHKYNNLNVVLDRNLEFEYTTAGRIHSLTESISLDNRILTMLEDHNIPYLRYTEFGKDRVLQIILRELKGV
jgi:nicotinamide riboside kinase